VKGEITVVIAGAAKIDVSVTLDDLVEQVQELAESGVRLKDASAQVVAGTKFSRRDVYEAVLAARDAD
jgi:16S rRNA (cytidine1402-2'-O)-methyltransferase